MAITYNDPHDLMSYQGCDAFHALQRGQVDPLITTHAVLNAAALVGWMVADDRPGIGDFGKILRFLKEERDKLEEALSVEDDETIFKCMKTCLDGLRVFHAIRLKHQVTHPNTGK
jgi:hypothetical protein